MSEFPFFPQPAASETVYSVFSRCIARSGLPERQILRELTGQPEGISFLCSHPGYLPNLAAHVPVGHPWRDVEYILRKNTASTYYLYFDSSNKRDQLLAIMATMNSPRAQNARIGLRVMGFNPLSCKPRFCSSCADEDKKTLGFSYYHREHQLPGIILCWKHGNCLVSNCNHCRPFPMCKAFRMPGKCVCQKRFSTVQILPSLQIQREPLLWLAKQSAIIVNSTGTPLENVRSILRTELIKNGFAQRGHFTPTKLAEALEARFGPDTLKYLGVPAWIDGYVAPWIHHLFSGLKTEKRIHPMVLILVIGTIFDSINAFEAAAQDSIDVVAWSKEDAPLSPKVLLARERLSNFIVNNPNTTRTLVKRKMHRLYSNLLQNDKDWFWTQIPSRKGQKIQIGKRKKRKDKDYCFVDKKMASDCNSAFDDLYGTKSKPIWATKTAVLNNINYFPKKLLAQGKLPLTHKILNKRSESREDFRVRLLKWAITRLATENEGISLRKITILTCIQRVIIKRYKDLIIEMVKHHGLSFSDRSWFVLNKVGY